MKSYLLIFALLLGAVSSWGQTVADQAAVLQKILDQPDLQQYYPLAPDQSREQVYVVQAPYAFPAGLQLSKFGKSVQFIANAKTLDNQSVAYFEFQALSINGNTADASFDFYYTLIRNKALFKCTVVLKKTGNDWSITETNLNRR